MPSLLTKIIAGDIYRKTRFHDEKGNLIPINQLFYLPLNIILFLRAKIFKKYPKLPWFPFNVLSHLRKIISKDWIMLEFGSGMSTLWFANKVKFIYSIEHDEYWYSIVSNNIQDCKVSNVKYELRSLEGYSNLDQITNRSIDFVVIDGWARSKCILASLSKLKPGGYIYLDNSDKDMTVENGDMRTCEKILREMVKEKNGQLWEFTGLTVGMINSHQGILARL
jgi:precorrin-6B methylase 2